MTSIGETFRVERLQRGLTLEQIAAETKIRVYLLEWMEAEQFDSLPEGFLRYSFLRQYARALGLNDEEILASYREQFEPPAPPAEATKPQSLPRLPPLPRPRALAWTVVAILACAIGSRLWNNGMPRLPKPETVEQTSAIPAPQEPRPVQSEQAPLQAVSGVHVSLKATEPVWLAIKSDGASAFSGTMAQQESKEFSASGKLTILVGNAGGLDVSLNGKSIGPLGASGEVRFVELTPEGVRSIPRTIASYRSTRHQTGIE